jgi:hypothetical protein
MIKKTQKTVKSKRRQWLYPEINEAGNDSYL